MFRVLTIRLQRTGKKKQVYYRIVVQEHSWKTGGKYLESLGNLDPHANKFNINKERLEYWMKNGIQISDTVWNYLVGNKLVSGEKRVIVKFKQEAKKEETVIASVNVSAPESQPA